MRVPTPLITIPGDSPGPEGEVNCTTANISGNLSGVVHVSEMLKVQATGKISGDISYGKLSVEPGAELEGKLSISGRVKDIASGGKQQGRQTEKTA